MPNTYPIQWRGETLMASDLTDAHKHRYCVWLYGHMLDNARRYKTASQYLEFDRKLTARPPEWTSLPSMEVLESFNTEAGRRQLLRIILSLPDDLSDAKYLSDADLDALVAEKEADPTSDLSRAMSLIREDADPKVPRGGRSSPAPTAASEPTLPSATTPSA